MNSAYRAGGYFIHREEILIDSVTRVMIFVPQFILELNVC